MMVSTYRTGYRTGIGIILVSTHRIEQGWAELWYQTLEQEREELWYQTIEQEWSAGVGSLLNTGIIRGSPAALLTR